MIQKLVIVWAASLLITGCATLTGSMTDSPIEAKTEGRTVGETIDDNNLRTRLLVNLNKLDSRYTSANVDINVYTGTVLIFGQVPTADLVTRTTELLKNDPQVKAIHNHLTVEPNIAPSLATNDKWLAIKIRSRMFTTDNFSSSNIEITVQKGIVYLMGRVTEATGNRAVEIAQQVNGVQKIVWVFQVIP